MSFLKNNSVAAILIAVAFLVIGYGLGKTSSSHRGCHKAHVECCSHDGHGDHAKCGKKAKCNKDSKCSKSCSKKCEGKSHEGCKGHGHDHDHGDHSKCSHGHHNEELIIVETLKDDGFEGDTTITIPGGEIKLSINGEDVEVEVEIDEEHYDGDVHEIHKEVVVVTTTSEDSDEDE